jgi:3-oxoacyl-[acyl-carrier protein] reductase
VTVNAILPGGMANVARISAHVYHDRSKLVQPEVMGPPIAWLMSDAADGTTGVRLTARAWAADVSDAENLERASVPAGWTTPRAAVLPQR